MRVSTIAEVGAFAEAAGDFLRSERLSANVIAVHVAGVLAGERAAAPGSTWVLVEDRGSTVGAAMRTPPHPLFLPRMPDGAPEAVATHLRSLPSVRDALPGVSGERSSAERFADAWCDGGTWRPRLQVTMRMYVLGRLRPPRHVRGRGRPARAQDAHLVAAWMRSFHDEALPGEPEGELTETVPRQIAAGHLWLWEDRGRPVALAGVSAPAAGVARVGPVYTPPLLRRNGYGAAVTAAASAAAIDAGAQDVALYTDLSNPTSNSIYQAIGFEPDHDALRYGFDAG